MAPKHACNNVEMYEKLLDVMHDNYLVQVQHKFTRITFVLDILFTN